MDAHLNFAYSLVATAPSPATSGTSFIVTAGQGALFPTPPFNATVWPVGLQPLASNAEIVRVTAISTDTFTIVRAQEGSTARTIIVGDQIAATITAKTLKDIEDADALKATSINPSISKGILTSGSAPSIAAGTGIGTSPTISITGNDICGYITFTVGTTPTATGIIGTITFNATLTNTPKTIMLTAGNNVAGTNIARYYAEQSSLSTSTWVLRNGSNVLTAAAVYVIFYLVIE